MKCIDVREQLDVEALCCLEFLFDNEGNIVPDRYKIRKLVSYRGIEIHCDFLEKHEDIRIYFDVSILRKYYNNNNNNNKYYRMYKGRGVVESSSCPFCLYHFVRNVSRETQELLLYSVFSLMMRKARKVYSVASDDAVSVDVAAAAAVAAYVDVAEAAHEAAHDAAHDAAAAAAYAAYVKKHARKAFRELMKWRRNRK